MGLFLTFKYVLSIVEMLPILYILNLIKSSVFMGEKKEYNIEISTEIRSIVSDNNVTLQQV